MSDTTSLLLKKMPEDIRNYLLKLQLNAKISKGRAQYSLESTIYSIIKKYKENTEKK